jgi:uncharacterized membrane protein YbhN (UPF0104 family)
MIEWEIIFSLNGDFIFYLLALVLIALLFLSFMVFRWIILIDSFSKIKSRFSVLYRYYLIGSFFNIFFPGAIGGDVVRIHYSKKQYRLGIKKATAIVFFERVAGLVALTLIFSFSIFFNDAIADKISIDKEYALLVIPLVLLIGFIFKKAASKKGYVISYITIGAILVLSILGQFADILIAYILCSYFDLTVTLWNLLTVMPLIFIITVLPISIGGIGVREGAFVGLLSLYNVSTSTAVIVSFLMYFIRVLVGIVGWVTYIKEGKSNTALSYERLQSNEVDPAIKSVCATSEKSSTN